MLTKKEKIVIAELRQRKGQELFTKMLSFFGSALISSLYNKGRVGFEGEGDTMLVVLLNEQ